MNRGANTAPDVRLDMHGRQKILGEADVGFLDVRVCHSNADSYRDLDPDQNEL